MTHPYITTATGRKFHFGLHDPSEFYLPDIARALSRICRFTGHLSDKYADDIYSVAQHSVYVERLLVQREAPDYVRKWALTHDAPEYVWGDVNSPLKSLLPDYRNLENASAAAFRTKYGIPYDDGIEAYVKWSDIQLLYAEAAEMTIVPPWEWDQFPGRAEQTLYEIDPDFYPWGPKKARDEYLAALDNLGIKE